MGEHRRKADGRRVLSTEFKRTAVQRILTGEKTLAELSRERALGRKTMEVEILRAAPEVVKKTPSLRRESGR